MNRSILLLPLLLMAMLTLACQAVASGDPPAPGTPEIQGKKASSQEGKKAETQTLDLGHGTLDTSSVAPATQPTTQTIDPQVADWLDRLEKQSAQVQTFSAALRWDMVSGLTGDQQRRFGKLYYQAGPPARFAVHFDRRLVDQRLDKLDHRWVFDGQWLVERVVSDSIKRFQKWQIVAPDAPPDQSNPLALGAGPFPLPIPFRKDVVLARFEVKLISPATESGKEPADSLHLQLIPKPNQRIRASSIDLWYDRQTLMPVRVRSTESQAENESTIDLSDPKMDQPIDPAIIDTTVPRDSGWDVQITPWKQP